MENRRDEEVEAVEVTFTEIDDELLDLVIGGLHMTRPSVGCLNVLA